MNPAAILLAAAAIATHPAEHHGNSSLTSLDNPPALFAQGTGIPLPEIGVPPPPKFAPTPGIERQNEKDLLISDLRSSVQKLTEALALANNESEVFKRQATELSLRLEALGIPGLTGDPSKVEQRLLAAVRDLRLAQERERNTQAQLVRLIEAIQLLISTTDGIEPQLRMSVETEIRKTNQLLGVQVGQQPEAVEPTLTDAMVSDVKPDLSLIVANIGAAQGVRIGMPFQVWRDNQRIGEVRVIDVRDRVSGAIIQSLVNEKTPIKTGDRLRVDAKR